MTARRAVLRALVAKKQGLVVPGAYDGISARLVQDAGFPAVYDRPLLYNYAPGGRSPLLPFSRLRELGFAIILLPVDTLLVAVQAIRAFLAQARARDDVRSLADLYMPFGDFNELIGVTAQLALAERYRDDDRSAT
jgi:2-methylisocitrate lyase-like PEP mutase family enzyme